MFMRNKSDASQSGLTKDEVNQIEKVLKPAFASILAKKYKSYDYKLEKSKRAEPTPGRFCP